MKYFKIVILIILPILMLLVLSSCGNKDKDQKNKIVIDSFEYHIQKNEQMESHDIIYDLSFNINFTVEETIQELIVLVETVRMLEYDDFHFVVDYCNTENVFLSPTTEDHSYAKLSYMVDTASVEVKGTFKITTKYLIDDINNFIKISCSSSQIYEIVDQNKLLNGGYIKLDYIDNSNIHYVYDEFSESYKVMAVTTQAEFFEIPDMYKDHPVKTIGEEAFRDCENLKSIVIPDCVNSIGEDAFIGCPNIENAVIPAIAATYLPKSRLKEVTITSGTELIANTFANCITLKSITIADSIVNLDVNAFAGCLNIEKVTIPANAISSFSKENLKEVVITNGNKIDRTAFAGCSNLVSITLPNGLESIGDYAFSKCNNIVQIIIPDSVRSIGAYAFWNCAKLKSIIIPNSVTSIGDYAFNGCGELESITIPNSITVMGEFVFTNCSSLKNVYYEGNIEDWCNGPITGSTFFSTQNLNHFYMKNSGRVYEEVRSISIPNTITTIKTSQFYGFNNVYSIILPNNIQNIGTLAFYGCSSLTSIEIPNSVTSIDADAFQNCYRLIEVYNYSSLSITAGSDNESGLGNYADVIHTKEEPSNIYKNDDGFLFYKDSLGMISLISYEGKEANLILPASMDGKNYFVRTYAFYKKDQLTNITIPKDIIIFGYDVFAGCINLQNVYYEGTLEDWCGIHFGSMANPMSYASHFYLKNSSSNWEEVTSIEIPDTITQIGNYQFYGFKNVTSISFSDQLSYIGDGAFYNCNSIESITIPNSVTSIGIEAFYNCQNLVRATIPEIAISTLPKDIVKEVIITDGYTISDIAFSSFINLEKIVLPSSIEYIGNNAFGSCEKLMSMTMPFVGSSTTNNTHFGYLFGASSPSEHSNYVPETLKEVIILGGESFSNEAFLDCTHIESITIPNTITSIGTNAFHNCSNLKRVYYDGSIEDWCKLSFDDNAYGNPMYYASNFYQKNSNNEWVEVTSIEIPDSITTIGEFQFLGFSNIQTIILPASITSINKSAFNRCSSLESIIIPDIVTSIEEYAFSKCENLISIVLPNTVSIMKEYTFYGCESLKEVYYDGTATEWKSMDREDYGNEALTGITIYYYSETEPTKAGHYWHYVDGVVTKW